VTKQALATVDLPVTVNWLQPGRVFRLSEGCRSGSDFQAGAGGGSADDLSRYVDGALLVDLWDELVLPRAVRAAWAPLFARDAFIRSPFRP
jgi:hypothetical protein